MTGIYRLAGRHIQITSLHASVHALCAGYRDEGAPDFAVETTKADIEYEREKSAREDERAGIPARRFSDGYLEELAAYRKIAEKAPFYDTLLFHGSVLSVDGAGYLFAAKSGTGKSTHARLWRELLGERAVMVNDDKPLLRVTEGGVTVYGTPWDGKHRLSADLAIPLRGIALLERAAENRIRPITAAEAYPLLLQQSYRPSDAAALSRTLSLLDRLAALVPLWRLGCNMERPAARLAFDTMRDPISTAYGKEMT